jgi:hypothetical protein
VSPLAASARHCASASLRAPPLDDKRAISSTRSALRSTLADALAHDAPVTETTTRASDKRNSDSTRRLSRAKFWIVANRCRVSGRLTAITRLAHELHSARKHRVEHRLSKSTGERVLLARVIRTQQRDLAAIDLHAMPELGSRLHVPKAARSLVREPAETHDNGEPLQRRDLTMQKRQAGITLARQRLVVGWCAAHRGRNPRVTKSQSVLAICRCRLVRQAGTMHRPIQPIAGTIAREDSTRAIRAVRCRRQPQHIDPSTRITEPGNRLAPVRFVAIGRPLLDRNFLTPGNKTRTRPAGLNIGGQ